MSAGPYTGETACLIVIVVLAFAGSVLASAIVNVLLGPAAAIAVLP
jgi:hypothetical protein